MNMCNRFALPDSFANMAPTAGLPVVILLAVYNGQSHLQAQLDSIVAQSHTDWRVLASDDGSCDDSRAILHRFADAGHPLVLVDGPQQGPAANFLHLLRCAAALGLGRHPIAFCDQDDVWAQDRLRTGLSALSHQQADSPALFCSRSVITDAALVPKHLSPLWSHPPAFTNALIQNIAAGHTLLLNPAASGLVCAAAYEAGRIVMHDWWIYQLVTGAGGMVLHDKAALVFYRQHGHNLIGANNTTRARLTRLGQLSRGDVRCWNDINIAALRRSAHRLHPANRIVLEGFCDLRRRSLPARLWALRRLGIHRQTRAGTVMMWFAALWGWL